MIDHGLRYLMAKKSKKKVEKKVENKEFVSKIRYLDILIDCSMKNVKGDGSSLDDLFKRQASRLLDQRKKLEEDQ